MITPSHQGFSIVADNYRRRGNGTIVRPYFVKPGGQNELVIVKSVFQNGGREFHTEITISGQRHENGLPVRRYGKIRSEERRVGKECRSRWAQEHYKKT